MNSQVYCLPQKLGWNAIQGFSKERADEKERYLKQKSASPYFVIKFNGPDPSPDIREEVKRRNPNLNFPISDAEVRVKKFLWSTDTHSSYTSAGLPASYKPLPPVTYETLADPPAIRRHYYRPMENIKPPLCTMGNDPERGLYEWREIIHRPGFGIWQRLEKIPFETYVGERNTILAPRLKRHDPNHEKERWDNVLNLARNNALSYGYCKQTTGFAGYKQTVEHISSNVESQPQNQSWISATHDMIVKFPAEAYMDKAERIRHRDSGFTSRLVTLADPNNPFIDDARLVGPQPYQKWAV